MTHRTSTLVSGLALLTLFGCGGGLRATSSISDDEWKPVQQGKEVVLYSGSPAAPDASEAAAAKAVCLTKLGKTREELRAGGGTPLGDAPWSASASAWTIQSSLVDDLGATAPDVYLELRKSGSTEQLWLYSKASTDLSCVYASAPGMKEAGLAIGKQFTWAPWRSTCSEIVAGGPRFKTLIESTPDGAALAADRVTLGAAGPIVNFAGGDLRVTPATLQACFAEAGSADAKLPEAGALALLRVSPQRCESERQGAGTHVACRSTVGAWNSDGSGIHGVRRTLGPVHFLDGKPVNGKRFARAVVAMDTGKASNSRETTLYAAIRGAASELISRGDDSVRIAPLGDPSVTSNVKIVVRDVSIGELRTTRSRLESRYVVSTETVRNTNKDSARSQLEQAEQMVSSKRSECNSMPTSDFSASQACVDRCVANSGGLAAATCGFTCKDAGGNSGAKDECNNAVDRAQSALDNARNEYNSMPDTVTNTIYGQWPYERIDYARKVTAVIQTESQSVGNAQKQATDPLEFEATDYEVVADGAHEVSGHSARRDFIDSPDSILPNLAERASAIAIKRLREALSQGAIDAALRALQASGGQAKAGYEAVDAMAFDVVGKRLVKAERYGDAGGSVPTQDVKLAGGECLLAVAVSADSASEVGLHTADGRFADQRKRPFATLELCSGEWTGEKPPATVLEGARVHWAVYRTRDQN